MAERRDVIKTREAIDKAYLIDSSVAAVVFDGKEYRLTKF